MADKTLLTIEEYEALGEDPPGVRYELSDGELIVTPSASFVYHNMRDEFNMHPLSYLDAHPSGHAVTELDFQLGKATVRRPNIAFYRNERLHGVDRNRAPLAAIPNLAIEIISPFVRAADLMKKVCQYLDGGVQSIWLFYPEALRAYHYVSNRLEPEVFTKDHDFSEPELLPGFKLKIAEILNPSGCLP